MENFYRENDCFLKSSDPAPASKNSEHLPAGFCSSGVRVLESVSMKHEYTISPYKLQKHYRLPGEFTIVTNGGTDTGCPEKVKTAVTQMFDGIAEEQRLIKTYDMPLYEVKVEGRDVLVPI